RTEDPVATRNRVPRAEIPACRGGGNGVELPYGPKPGPRGATHAGGFGHAAEGPAESATEGEGDDPAATRHDRGAGHRHRAVPGAGRAHQPAPDHAAGACRRPGGVGGGATGGGATAPQAQEGRQVMAIAARDELLQAVSTFNDAEAERAIELLAPLL